jgi:UDP-N-acetylglucosamine 2-epimerase (non-hydrolysing)
MEKARFGDPAVEVGDRFRGKHLSERSFVLRQEGEVLVRPRGDPVRASTGRASITRTSRHAVLIIAGTRPECIKLAPIVRELARQHVMRGVVVNSGQHAEAVRRTFGEFHIKPDHDLPPMPPMPNLSAASGYLTRQLEAVIAHFRPTMVLVQGDTLTAYAGARAGTAARCPVIHVEAGLRAPTLSEPFPEEWFRRRIARHAQFHFTPCASAHANLLAEGATAESIHAVGNTGIDSLRTALEQHTIGRPRATTASPRVLVTLHRRENWDGKADVVCDALIALAMCRPDLEMLIPVHPNPRVAARLHRRLGGRPQFSLVAPMGYGEFIATAATAALIISDSGGIQEEAPYLGVPLLVPRSCTERPEALTTGFVRLVAIDREAIVREALSLMSARRIPALAFDIAAPFGDGLAARRIVDILECATIEAVAA